MFIRKKSNNSGSVSIQIIAKVRRKNKLLKTVGCAKTKREEELRIISSDALEIETGEMPLHSLFGKKSGTSLNPEPIISIMNKRIHSAL